MKAFFTGLAMMLLAVAPPALVMAPALTIGPALAMGIDQNRFTDPAEEAHAQALMRQFRCLVCQNESIADSDAALAADLRTIVRERIRAGDSDAQVKAYLTARYGDWVLLKPPFNSRTLILWVGPFALLMAGGLALALRARRRKESGPELEPLSGPEKKQLQGFLDDEANLNEKKGRPE